MKWAFTRDPMKGFLTNNPGENPQQSVFFRTSAATIHLHTGGFEEYVSPIAKREYVRTMREGARRVHEATLCAILETILTTMQPRFSRKRS